jgi:hypothetical protein
VSDPTAFKLIVISAIIVTVVFSSAAIWLAINLAKTSSEAVKASADAARHIAASVDKIEAMLAGRHASSGSESRKTRL